jgi:hypothetical protein
MAPSPLAMSGFTDSHKYVTFLVAAQAACAAGNGTASVSALKATHASASALQNARLFASGINEIPSRIVRHNCYLTVIMFVNFQLTCRNCHTNTFL